jgi:hypothetical protein
MRVPHSFVMICANQEKRFVWHERFSGKSGTKGWSYDLTLVLMNFMIAAIDSGSLSMMRLFR